MPGQKRKHLGEECVGAAGVHVVSGSDCHQRRTGNPASEGSDLALWKMAVGSAGNDESACRDEVQVLPPNRVWVVALLGNGVQRPPIKWQRYRRLARHHSRWNSRKRWWWSSNTSCRTRPGSASAIR